MKVLCDHMLGSLARWLRFMGLDAAYPDPMDDRGLMEKAREEGRVLITRDKELAARFQGSVHVRSDVLEEQIREVASVLALRIVDPLSRCSLCNVLLMSASSESVRDLVPEGVLARQDTFSRCPSCGKVYWQGSHWGKMIERLNRLDLQGP